MGSHDVEVYGDDVAVDADALGSAASLLSDVRDGLNSAWRQGPTAFGNSPASAAFDGCSSAWIGAADTLANLFDVLGTYTQDIANQFGALDTVMEGGATVTFSQDDLPKRGETRVVNPDAPVA